MPPNEVADPYLPDVGQQTHGGDEGGHHQVVLGVGGVHHLQEGGPRGAAVEHDEAARYQRQQDQNQQRTWRHRQERGKAPALPTRARFHTQQEAVSVDPTA